MSCYAGAIHTGHSSRLQYLSLVELTVCGLSRHWCSGMLLTQHLFAVAATCFLRCSGFRQSSHSNPLSGTKPILSFCCEESKLAGPGTCLPFAPAAIADAEYFRRCRLDLWRGSKFHVSGHSSMALKPYPKPCGHHTACACFRRNVGHKVHVWETSIRTGFCLIMVRATHGAKESSFNNAAQHTNVGYFIWLPDFRANQKIRLRSNEQRKCQA